MRILVFQEKKLIIHKNPNGGKGSLHANTW